MTFSEALAATREAFDEGRLGAQRGHNKHLCHYPDGSVCPVGASFQVAPEDNELSISELTREGRLEVTDEDRRLIKIMQELHDFWIDGASYGLFRVTNSIQPNRQIHM